MACTVHKVQGLTVLECVVDLNNSFVSGQAYVALSRVTSIQGLYTKDMNASMFNTTIRCDPDIEKGVEAMGKYIPAQVGEKSGEYIKIMYNVSQYSGFESTQRRLGV